MQETISVQIHGWHLGIHKSQVANALCIGGRSSNADVSFWVDAGDNPNLESLRRRENPIGSPGDSTPLEVLTVINVENFEVFSVNPINFGMLLELAGQGYAVTA